MNYGKWRRFCSTIVITTSDAILKLTFVCTTTIKYLLSSIAIDNLYMHSCSHWLLYLLEWFTTFAITTFVCTIAVDKFSMNYCNWHPLFTLLWWTSLVGTIAYNTFNLHYCNWKFFCAHYYNEQLLYGTLYNFYEQLKFRTIYCTMAMDTIANCNWFIKCLIDNFCT